MSKFLAILAVFLLSHVIPARLAIRQRITALVGERAFVILYSIMSASLFLWMVRAGQQATYIPLWPRTPALFALTGVLQVVAVLLMAMAAHAPNPLSISFSGGFDPQRPGVVAITRHPLLWGLWFWAAGHLPANGDVVGLILFGGLTVFATVGILVVEKRRKRILGPAWHGLAAGTSIVPFAAILAGRARLPTDVRTLRGVIVGLVITAILVFGGHAWLFHRHPLPF